MVFACDFREILRRDTWVLDFDNGRAMFVDCDCADKVAIKAVGNSPMKKSELILGNFGPKNKKIKKMFV